MLSVVIPAYNEGKRIYSNLCEIDKTIQKISPRFELIIVDDGSTDNTLVEAKRFSKGRQNVKVLSTKNNSGKGGAILIGSCHASGDLIAFVDADLELHPSQLSNFLKIMKETNADVVIGSKRHPLSKLSYPLKRKFLSSCYHLLTLALFGLPVSDTQAGLKLFKRKVLDTVTKKLLVKKYAFDLELLVNIHRKGFKIVEAPIVVVFKRGFGRIGFRSIVPIWIDTMAIFYRTYILRYYD